MRRFARNRWIWLVFGAGGALVVRHGLGQRRGPLHVATRTSPPFEARPKSDALVEAASNGDLKEMRRLLASGVSPDADSTGDEGESALSAAASNGHLEAVRLLLDKGADVNDEDFWGGNALVGASVFGQIDTVRLLLARGADPNMEDDGVTALDYAAHQLVDHETKAPSENYRTIVRLLQDAGGERSHLGGWLPGL